MAKQPGPAAPPSLGAAVLGEGTALASSASFGGGYGAEGVAQKSPRCHLDDTSDDICRNEHEHYPFLDITRICCVGLVALDHGAPEFGQWNVFFAQAWVLQYLYLVCGVCYGMSKKSLCNYELRLCAYCALGVCINWSAWLLMGMDWRSNFFSVVFHFWFVVGLIFYTLLLAPARTFLERTRQRCDNQLRLGVPAQPADMEASPAVATVDITVETRALERDALLFAGLVVGGGWLAFTVIGNVVVQPLLKMLAPELLHLVHTFGSGTEFWGLPQNGEEALNFLSRLCNYATVTATNVYFIFVCPHVFRHRQLTAWFVFGNTYLNRLWWFRDKDERPWHGFDLMTLALTTYYLGLLHRRTLGKYMARYWFLLLLACALLWPNGLHVRLDENPPVQDSLRIRSNLIEAMFVLLWLCAGERLVSREIFTEDRLDFMNDWALVVFLVHKAVHIMIPSPLNWVVILGIAPACYARRHMA